jgi:hypothetical protein
VRNQTKSNLFPLACAAVLGLALSLPVAAGAHCDTLDGPVVGTARTALEKGDVTPVLKWVRPEEEGEIRAAFERTLAVRGKGAAERELADLYFFETLVRVHRAGEGAPYTGLKPGAAIDPAVALADKALESGSVDKLADVLANAMTKGIRERFADALEKRKHTESSVDAGREFVESYVVFTHYVEGLHGLIQAGAAHHGGAQAAAGHGH